MSKITFDLEDISDPYDYQALCLSLVENCKEIREFGEQLEAKTGRDLDSYEIVEAFPHYFYMTIDSDLLAKNVKISD